MPTNKADAKVPFIFSKLLVLYFIPKAIDIIIPLINPPICAKIFTLGTIKLMVKLIITIGSICFFKASAIYVR